MGRKHGMRTMPADRPAGYSSNNNTIFISGRKSLNPRAHKWNNKPAQDNLSIIRAWVKVKEYRRVTLHAMNDSHKFVRLYVNGIHIKDFNLNSGWEGRIMRVIERAA